MFFRATRILPRCDTVCAMKTTNMFSFGSTGGPARTGPVHLADGSFRRAHAGFGPNREAQPKAEAGSGQVVRSHSNARGRPDVVGAHIGDRLRAKITVSVERTTVQDHLSKPRVVAISGYP